MAITGMQFHWLWARHFDGAHSHSVTVQVPGVDAVCEIALHGKWTPGAAHHAADAFITQIVSASGVENFPNKQTTNASIRPVVYRRKVTSVTFKLDVYKSKGTARWMIYHWA
jgi:hypothetical protein